MEWPRLVCPDVWTIPCVFISIRRIQVDHFSPILANISDDLGLKANSSMEFVSRIHLLMCESASQSCVLVFFSTLQNRQSGLTEPAIRVVSPSWFYVCGNSHHYDL